MYLECRDCGSLWQHPPPHESALAAFYPPDYGFTHGAPRDALGGDLNRRARLKWQLVAALFGYQSQVRVSPLLAAAAHAAPFVRRRAGFAVRFLMARPQGRLLDVGCGNGSFLLTMRRLGWDVEGIEPDPLAARWAREHGVPIQATSVMDAGLEETAYDAVTMSHAIEHVLDPAGALRRLAAALKPGGVLVSVSPNPEGVLADAFRAHWFELDCPRHVVIPSAGALRLMCDQAGLRAKTSTSMRLFRWALAGSEAIRDTGHVSFDLPRRLADRISAASIFVRGLTSGRGEEIVCVALKP